MAAPVANLPSCTVQIVVFDGDSESWAPKAPASLASGPSPSSSTESSVILSLSMGLITRRNAHPSPDVFPIHSGGIGSIRYLAAFRGIVSALSLATLKGCPLKLHSRSLAQPSVVDSCALPMLEWDSMTPREGVRSLLLLAALAPAVVTACGAGAAGSPKTAATFRCSPTKPQPLQEPSSSAQQSAASFNYGSKLLRAELPPRGDLPAGTLPNGAEWARINRDGSISTKLGWWRGLRGRLRISGHRLDAAAPPLKARLPSRNSYPPTGFTPSNLTFPTVGCWRVSARLGRAHLSFVLSVLKVRQ